MRRFRVAVVNGIPFKTGKAPRIDRRRNTASTKIISAIAEKSTTVTRAKSELRVVPGVGPINEGLLHEKGIVSVANLRSVFHDKFNEEDVRFVEYLHQEVGIRHRRYCRSIIGFLKELSERNETPTEQDSNRITLSIEGNVSAGKTTFLKMIKDAQRGNEVWMDVVPEPVQQWQKVGGRAGNNLLQRFYDDPARYAYEFQNYVFLTRLEINKRTFEGVRPLRLIERSVFSDRLVFVRAVHEEKWMDDFQLELYDSWFNPMIREVPGLIPDGFIYLRAEPDTCMKRLRRRNRAEECRVTNDYLKGLHEKHEEWFNQSPPPTLVETTSVVHRTERRMLLPQPCDAESPIEVLPSMPKIPDELKDSVIWLGESGILSNDPVNRRGAFSTCWISHDVKTAMSQIPALVLDCNDDIDIKKDIRAKEEYAKKVKMYYEFVRAYAQSQQRYRPFWNLPAGECLRRRWYLVNSMSDEEVSQRFKEQWLRELRESGSLEHFPLNA